MAQSDDDIESFDDPPDEDCLRSALGLIEEVGEIDWSNDLEQWQAFRIALKYVRAAFPEESQQDDGIERRIIAALARAGLLTMELVPEECFTGFVMPDPS